MTKAELNDFKPGRGIPSCVLEARPLCEDFPQLVHQIILKGIKPPHHKVILSYLPPKINRGIQSLYHYNNKGHTACADYCIQCHVLIITIHVDAHLPAEDGVEMTRKFLYLEGKTFDCHTAV